MAKSAIYTANTTTVAGVASGSTLPMGATVRRFGCNCKQDGTGIVLDGQGYYDARAVFTLTSAAADVIKVQMYKDGTPVTGASASVDATAAGTVIIPVNAIVRNQCGVSSVITFVVTAETAGTTVTDINSSVVVVKL